MTATTQKDKRAYSVDYFRKQPFGGVGVIRADEIPNLVKVAPDFRVEVTGDHSPGCVRQAAALFSRKWAQVRHAKWVSPCRFSGRRSGY
jgi:hypothetical protein